MSDYTQLDNIIYWVCVSHLRIEHATEGEVEAYISKELSRFKKQIPKHVRDNVNIMALPTMENSHIEIFYLPVIKL